MRLRFTWGTWKMYKCGKDVTEKGFGYYIHVMLPMNLHWFILANEFALIVCNDLINKLLVRMDKSFSNGFHHYGTIKTTGKTKKLLLLISLPEFVVQGSKPKIDWSIDCLMNNIFNTIFVLKPQFFQLLWRNYRLHQTLSLFHVIIYPINQRQIMW